MPYQQPSSCLASESEVSPCLFNNTLLGPDGGVGSGLGAARLLAVTFLGVAGRAQGLQVVLLVGIAEAPGGNVVDDQVLRGAAPGACFGQFGAQLLFVFGFEGRAHGAEELRVRQGPNTLAGWAVRKVKGAKGAGRSKGYQPGQEGSVCARNG